MYQFNINKDRSIEQDKVFLVDRLFNIIENGEIYPISDLQIIANLNSNWECNFTVYKENNGVLNPLWDKITDLALVKIENKGIFELETPVTDENCTFKQCHGKSICESEISQTNMTIEINTEDDISRDDYYEEFPTVFYRDVEDITVFNGLSKFSDKTQFTDNKKKQILKDSSLLHRVFSEMPEYIANINGKNIDDSLKNLEYIFSWNDTSVYDICQDIAEEIQCIFIFDKFSRFFEVRDLKDHCLIDGCRDIQDGICPVCQQNGTTQNISSFGNYSGVEIDTHNLAETIQLTGDVDSIKNYFKIEGADDVITNRISNRLIGNGYLWKLGTLQKSQMSKNLVDAIEAREQMMEENNYQETYEDLWDQWNTLEEKILDYQSGMMPSPEIADENAEYVFHYLFGKNGKIDYACASNRYQTQTQIADSVINYAKLLSPTNHTIEYTDLSYAETKWNGYDVISSITFKVHIYLDGYYIDDDETKGYMDEYTSPTIITLKVSKGYDITYTEGSNAGIYTTDYYNYLKRLIDTANAKSDITDEIITFDPKTPYNIDPEAKFYKEELLKSTHYSKYCYSRLDSFYKAYEACSAVVAGINSTIASDERTVDILKYLTSDGTISNIQNDLLGKYKTYMELISERMNWLNQQIEQMKMEQNSLMNEINKIKEICDMKNCLNSYASDHGISQNLWYELCSFKRQDTYRNDNFIGEGTDDATLMKNVEDLLKRAEEEIESACNITYSASATISNLLVMPEFEAFWDKFTLGNYIHMVIDDQIHTMRLISITYDYSDLSHCSVEFSDVIRKTKNKTEEIADILSQATSLASSAKTTARQAENGAAAKLSVDMIKNDALNLANSKIITADDQNFVIDKYGITGKYIDPVSGEVSGEQIRIINNLLCFTDDNWMHTKTALGKIDYLNPDTNQYETKYGLIADTIIGNLLLGEKLIIRDDNGYVRIDGNGVTLDGGAITWKTPINTKDINGLDQYMDDTTLFKSSVSQALGLGTTVITPTSIISPKIGGGYLYIVDGDNSITLNPYAGTVSNGTHTSSTNMFEIVSNKTPVLFVDKSGNLSVSGKINATSGYIGDEIDGWTISNNAIYNGCDSLTVTNKNGTYIGTDGLLNRNDSHYTKIFQGIIDTNHLNAQGGKISVFTIDGVEISYQNKISGHYVSMDSNGFHTKTFMAPPSYLSSLSTSLTSSGVQIVTNLPQTECISIKCDNIDFSRSLIMRSNYLDFSDSTGKRSAMGYINVDTNAQSDETGFYLIGSDNTIHGSFYMAENSNISNFLCDYITSCEGITLNLNKYIMSNTLISGTNTKISIIGRSSSSTLWVGHYDKAYQGYTNSIQLNANSTISVGTFYTPDGSVSQSDIRLKTEIMDIDENEINFILGLHPKKYKLKDGDSGRYHYGLIAQDVDELMHNTIGDVGLLVKKEQFVPDDERYIPIDFQDDTTFYYGLRYEEFISPMIKTIQKLNSEIQELKEQIRRQ